MYSGIAGLTSLQLTFATNIMEEKRYKGKISYINYEKHFATIDYAYNNKHKSVNCKTNAADSSKKPQHYRLGDEVSFQLKLSDRGDKMTAYNVKYRHNEAIALLIQKAAKENRFSGYLKKIDEYYFVKEVDSYILFPLQLSPWELPPATTAENEIISFSLINLDKPNAIKAELFSHFYISEYKKAELHFEKQFEINAMVAKVTPYAVYLDLFNDKLQTRLTLTPEEKETTREGDTIKVLITHLTPFKIVVKKVS